MALTPRPFAAAVDPWEVLDRLVEDVSRLARSAPPPTVFWPALLRRAVEGLAAEGGVVWPCRADRPVAEGRFEWGRPAAIGVEPTADSIRLAAAVESVRSRRAAEDSAPRRSIAEGGAPEVGLLVAPVLVDDRPTAVLELTVGRELEPDARETALRLLEELALLAADYQRERQRRELADEAESLRQVDDFALQVHSANDTTTAAYILANEAVRLLPCDRAAVLLVEGAECRAVAVSGADSIDRRAMQVRGLEQLAATVQPSGERLRIAGGERQVPAAAAAALEAYVAASNVRALAVERLGGSGGGPGADSTGVLIVERFGDGPKGAVDNAWNEARLGMLVRHGGLALERAGELDAVPTALRSRRRQAGSRRRWLWPAVAAALLVGPFLIPAPFNLEARGELQPAQRRTVFAPSDGIVQEILVRDGQTVAAGDVLVKLRRPELDVELARVLGEIETARSRLAAIRALRAGPTGDASAVRRGQELTAEEEQLKMTLAGRDDELKLLRLQQAELELRAPLSGRVIAWDLEQTLTGRPVARGARLLEVADVGGAWIVDLQVSERYAGDVAATRGAQADPPAVEFVAAVAPDRHFEGRLVRMAPAVEIDPELGVVVPSVVEAPAAAAEAIDRRPGAVVTARIHCGRRTLGYVWWHDAWRGLQAWWF
jgi:multidrug efflux pump subunit AcrA (membrane-fusion protein)